MKQKNEMLKTYAMIKNRKTGNKVRTNSKNEYF